MEGRSEPHLNSACLVLAQSIAESLAAFAEVEAVALAGSATSGSADFESDIDLYVYITKEIP